MDSRSQIDFLATLSLSLKVMKKAEPGFSVDELRRMIEERIAALKAEASLQRRPAALDIPCPVSFIYTSFDISELGPQKSNFRELAVCRDLCAAEG